ncbi:hypothetical protein AB0M11_26560 [Streptomyces sp. NPDC051987]|uniref:hypothetical protein n=1 Tax=Streptomyces sp. NPDC051987 TaxID=3155808 RepID=UPI00342610ED
MAHTIRCAHDDCPELSTIASFKPKPREQQAADHRRALAAEGWSDVEGRDYCPDHDPRQPDA